MRRMIITAVATLSLAAPSAALAHNGGRHHGRHGRRHGRVHVLAFHAQAPASSTTGTSAPGSTPSTADSAGTIASFANETLTITLSDGTTVSGKVNERTEIECAMPSASAADFGGRGQDGSDDNGNDGNAGPGIGDGEHEGSGCPGHEGGADGQSGHCTTAALVPGTSVKEAFLSVSSQGAVWVKVEL